MPLSRDLFGSVCDGEDIGCGGTEIRIPIPALLLTTVGTLNIIRESGTVMLVITLELC